MAPRFYKECSLVEANYKGRTLSVECCHPNSLPSCLSSSRSHESLLGLSRSSSVCAIQVVAFPTPDIDKRGSKSLVAPSPDSSPAVEPSLINVFAIVGRCSREFQPYFEPQP